MKKIILLILPLMLVACNQTPSSVMTSSSSEESSSGVPNNLQPLVAFPDCDVPTLDNYWVAKWADEFNGDTLDTTKWNYEVNGDGGGNQELQYYRAENVSEGDGNLVITAKKEAYSGKQYTSGRINTKYRFDTLYGRVQVRAKLPGGIGTWSAIWMMPLFNVYGQWPKSGEIDIAEHVGYNPTKVYATVHTQKFNSSTGTIMQGVKTVEGIEDDYHLYEMIWSPGNIQMFYDGAKYLEFGYTPQFNQDVPYYQAFPFDQEFFMILNLAIGGTWGGQEGVDDSIFPVSMAVDYVRVYGRDYASFDVAAPTTPTTLAQATLKNTFHWIKSTDDGAVEKYAIYVDGNFLKYVNLNQCTLTGLVSGQTYAVQAQAVDFAGRTSALSDPLNIVYEG